MSKHNKANKDSYVQAGRLTPDELARERQKQAEITSAGRERMTARAPAVRGAAAPRRLKKR